MFRMLINYYHATLAAHYMHHSHKHSAFYEVWLNYKRAAMRHAALIK